MRTSNGSSRTKPLLLDTHFWIWLQAGSEEQLNGQDLEVVLEAANRRCLYVSAISVWEFAMLEAKGRVLLRTSCAQWVEQALSMPGLSLAPLTPAIAVESTRLPGSFHGDPADRIIVATARTMNARLLTVDGDIRTYGRASHVLLA